MVKKLFFCLVIFFLLVHVTSATDTDIKIKTIPGDEVQATMYDSKSASFSVLPGGAFKGITDEYGDFSFVFATEKEEFNIIIYIKKDGEKRMESEKILNHPAGENLELRLAPDWFEFIETPINGTLEKNETIKDITTNESELENQTIGEITPEEIKEGTQPQMAGSAIFGDKGFLSKKAIYYIIGIVVLLIGFILAGTLRTKLRGSKEIKIKKLSEMQGEKKEKIKDKKEIIEDAERKIKEAQEDIRKIKSNDGIEKAKKKIIEDEKELIRLRKERE